MAGICSEHQGYDENCELCKSIESNPDKIQDAGEYRCWHCGFVYYLVVVACPKCEKEAYGNIIDFNPKPLTEEEQRWVSEIDMTDVHRYFEKNTN